MTTNPLRPRPGRRFHVRAGVALLVLGAVGLSACGDDGDDGDAGASRAPSRDAAGTQDSPRTVEVDMVDNAFEPTDVEVDVGETVRFVLRNEGAVVHDAVIGDEAAQDEHEDEMRAAEETTSTAPEDDMGDMGDMGHGTTSEEEAAITVEPGEQGEITYTFDSAGELLIGCHEPGHYEAGMRIVVEVA